MSTKIDAKKWIDEELGPLTFGKFLIACRNMIDATQVEMAQKIEVSKSMVCDIEKGRQTVSPRLALKIAKKAGLPEKIAIKLCLQDQLDRAKIKMKVEIAS